MFNTIVESRTSLWLWTVIVYSAGVAAGAAAILSMG